MGPLMYESSPSDLLGERQHTIPVAEQGRSVMATKDKGATGPTISAKVSEKGAVSIYGLGRFPVTLYKEQLTAILDKEPALRKFMKDNDKALKSKAEHQTAKEGTTAL